MGKQVYFYMLPEDEEQFMRFVFERAGAVLLPEICRHAVPEILTKLATIGGSERGPGVLLWNRLISPPVITRYIPEQKYYAVDKTQSEVIEFWRSRLSGDSLRPGRLWCEPNALDESFNQVAKSNEFIKWCESLMRWIRRNLTRHAGSYVGKHALAWAESGGKLT